MDDRTGILLLNLGGPWSPEGVRPFLRSLFRDRAILAFPGGPALQGVWARFLAALRAPVAARRYAAIGGASPLLFWTRVQAFALERRLCGATRVDPTPDEIESLRAFDTDRPGLPPELSGGPFVAAIAMRYAEPTARAAIDHCLERGCRRAVALPLYPHACAATTGSSLADLERAAAGRMPLTIVRSFHDHPAYLRAAAARIREGLALFPEPLRHRVTLLFSAHAVPLSFVRRGDPYVRQVKENARALLHELRGEIGEHRLAYQSRAGPVRWTTPGVGDVIEELGRKGARAVLVASLSFVSDHIETLHEIDIELAAAARRAGIEWFHRVPALNDSPLFADALAAIVRGAMEDDGASNTTGRPAAADQKDY